MSDDLSAHDVASLVEFGEAEAYADLFSFAPASLGFRVQRIGGGVLLLAERLDILLWNRVIGLGVREPATEALLDQIIATYQHAGLRNFGVQVSPASLPASLPAWLAERNFVSPDRWAKVFCRPSLTISVPTTLRTECIGRDAAPMFAEVACTAFRMPSDLEPWLAQSVGQPGWRHYLAFDGDQPVATGALFIRNRIGWLGIGSTLPTHRRRGAQGALMAQRIRDAAAAGCDWVITETGEDLPGQPNPSFHNMIRTGFKLAYQRPNYVFQSAPRAA
jgi:hypothetical protein